MKKILIIGFINLLLHVSVFGQSINAAIPPAPASGLYVGTGASLHIVGEGTLTLQDSKLENKGMLSDATGTLYITGSSTTASSIQGNGQTSLNNVVINKTLSNFLVEKNFSVAGSFNFLSGNVSLLTGNINFGSTGQILNETENKRFFGSGGFLQSTVNLNAPVNQNPANLGVVISSPANLGSTVIKRSHSAVTINGASINRTFDIQPSNNNGLNATLKLSYFDAELNGNTEANLGLWQSKNAGTFWSALTTTNDVTNNFIQSTGIESLGLFTGNIANLPTTTAVNPTAVCRGQNITLSATCISGTVSWYNQATGGTAIGMGSSLVYAPPSTATFYVACSNPAGESERVNIGEVIVKTVPTTPTIAGNNEICEGEVASLSANSVFTFSNANPVYQWSNGTSGFNIQVGPSVTSTYSVTVTVDGCTSKSSAVFTVIVNPKPAIPTITADNMTICKGGSVILIGTCAVASDIFRWETPPFGEKNATSLTNINQRAVTEPGIYRGLCESNKGCLSEKQSITITLAEGCNPANFITVSPEKPVVCPNASINLTANGCSGGTVTWQYGTSSQTGNSINVSQSVTTSYFVTCSTGGSTIVDVLVAVPNITVANNVTTGKEIYKAINSIQSAKKIGDVNFTPAPNVIYEAGGSITLSPGFVAEKWSVFKAEIKTCNN